MDWQVVAGLFVNVSLPTSSIGFTRRRRGQTLFLMARTKRSRSPGGEGLLSELKVLLLAGVYAGGRLQDN